MKTEPKLEPWMSAFERFTGAKFVTAKAIGQDEIDEEIVKEEEDIKNMTDHTKKIIERFDICFPYKLGEVINDFGSSVKSDIRLFIVEEINQAEQEMIGKIEAMRDLPPPYPADKENPMKHIYQNEGYAKALEDILSTE